MEKDSKSPPETPPSSSEGPNSAPDHDDGLSEKPSSGIAGEVQGPSDGSATPASRPLAIQKTRSYGDGHGFVCHVHGRDSVAEEKAEAGEGRGEKPQKDEEAAVTNDDDEEERRKFEVRWEGKDDPMDPKNMSKVKKWVVVYIVSAGSTCV